MNNKASYSQLQKDKRKIYDVFPSDFIIYKYFIKKKKNLCGNESYFIDFPNYRQYNVD